MIFYTLQLIWVSLIGTTKAFSCPNPDNKYLTVWQWVSTMSHPEDDSTTEIAFDQTFCLYGETGSEEPQCPVGFCDSDDKTCQTCIDGWEA